jgi:hypothetical protein
LTILKIGEEKRWKIWCMLVYQSAYTSHDKQYCIYYLSACNCGCNSKEGLDTEGMASHGCRPHWIILPYCNVAAQTYFGRFHERFGLNLTTINAECRARIDIQIVVVYENWLIAVM